MVQHPAEPAVPRSPRPAPRRLLDNGRLIVAVDGVDELPEKALKEFTRAISAYAAKRPVRSCADRPTGGDDTRRRGTPSLHIELADMHGGVRPAQSQGIWSSRSVRPLGDQPYGGLRGASLRGSASCWPGRISRGDLERIVTEPSPEEALCGEVLREDLRGLR